MDSTIIVALISFLGSSFATFAGILTANKLSAYRIEQLEKKVEKHNNIVERTFKIEGKLEEIAHDIEDLKRKE